MHEDGKLGGEKPQKHYWQNLELAALRDVYLPAEDSELLADAAYAAAYGRVLEIGCGSGIVSIAVSRKIEVRELVASDISPSAIKCAKFNAEKNHAGIRFYRGNLFAALPKNIGKFDLIMFNPPYLPTGASEHVHGRLDKALDGGKGGIEVAVKFIRGAGSYLADGGAILIVTSTAQNLERLGMIAQESGFRYGSVAEFPLFFEKLAVWKLVRK